MAAEIGAILVLVCLVAIFGPQEATAAQVYAEKLGQWVGPLAGAILGFLGAFLVARPLERDQLLHGALFGCFHALIDIVLLVAMQAPFEWLFVASNAGKVFAAITGGFCAALVRRNSGVAIRPRFCRCSKLRAGDGF
jgi:hypothetical protein